MVLDFGGEVTSVGGEVFSGGGLVGGETPRSQDNR